MFCGIEVGVVEELVPVTGKPVVDAELLVVVVLGILVDVEDMLEVEVDVENPGPLAPPIVVIFT